MLSTSRALQVDYRYSNYNTTTAAAVATVASIIVIFFPPCHFLPFLSFAFPCYFPFYPLLRHFSHSHHFALIHPPLSSPFPSSILYQSPLTPFHLQPLPSLYHHHQHHYPCLVLITHSVLFVNSTYSYFKINGLNVTKIPLTYARQAVRKARGTVKLYVKKAPKRQVSIKVVSALHNANTDLFASIITWCQIASNVASYEYFFGLWRNCFEGFARRPEWSIS